MNAFALCTTRIHEDALRLIGDYVIYYNTQRLHAGIGYVTPHDKINGHAPRIHEERDQKLAAARAKRKVDSQNGQVA